MERAATEKAGSRRAAVLVKESLAEQIFRVLKARILDLSLGPGEKINIQRLKEELVVSGAPVRDALLRLASSGLVEIRPRVGFFVRRIDMEEVRQIFKTRRLFEVYGLKNAFGRVPLEEIRRWRAESMKMAGRAPFSARELERLEQIDESLHRDLLIGLCGNAYIQRFYLSVHDPIVILRHMQQRHEADIREHLALFDALLSADADAAERALLEHLNQVERDLSAYLETNTHEEIA